MSSSNLPSLGHSQALAAMFAVPLPSSTDRQPEDECFQARRYVSGLISYNLEVPDGARVQPVALLELMLDLSIPFQVRVPLTVQILESLTRKPSQTQSSSFLVMTCFLFLRAYYTTQKKHCVRASGQLPASKSRCQL